MEKYHALVLCRGYDEIFITGYDSGDRDVL